MEFVRFAYLENGGAGDGSAALADHVTKGSKKTAISADHQTEWHGRVHVATGNWTQSLQFRDYGRLLWQIRLMIIIA